MVLFFLYLNPPVVFLLKLFVQTCVPDHSHRALLSCPLTMHAYLCFLLVAKGQTSDLLELHWLAPFLRAFLFVSSTPTTVEDMLPSRDHRNWPHVAWWLHGHRAGEQVNSVCVRAETEVDDCRCERYGIACGIVPTCWRSDVFSDRPQIAITGDTDDKIRLQSHPPADMVVDAIWLKSHPRSGQMRIWPRTSSRSRPTLIWSSWNRMHTTRLVNLLVGCCMRWTWTNRHIQVWTKVEQSNGWICTRSSTVQPLKKAVFELIKESLADFHLVSYLIEEVQIGSVDSVSKLRRHFHYISRRFAAYPFRVYHALHSHGIYGKLRRCFRAIRVCRLLMRRELR